MMIEALVKKVEELNMYADDQGNEYHLFDEFFEEMLYQYLYKPGKRYPTCANSLYGDIFSVRKSTR